MPSSRELVGELHELAVVARDADGDRLTGADGLRDGAVVVDGVVVEADPAGLVEAGGRGERQRRAAAVDQEHRGAPGVVAALAQARHGLERLAERCPGGDQLQHLPLPGAEALGATPCECGQHRLAHAHQLLDRLRGTLIAAAPPRQADEPGRSVRRSHHHPGERRVAEALHHRPLAHRGGGQVVDGAAEHRGPLGEQPVRDGEGVHARAAAGRLAGAGRRGPPVVAQLEHAGDPELAHPRHVGVEEAGQVAEAGHDDLVEPVGRRPEQPGRAVREQRVVGDPGCGGILRDTLCGDVDRGRHDAHGTVDPRLQQARGDAEPARGMAGPREPDDLAALRLAGAERDLHRVVAAPAGAALLVDQLHVGPDERLRHVARLVEVAEQGDRGPVGGVGPAVAVVQHDGLVERLDDRVVAGLVGLELLAGLDLGGDVLDQPQHLVGAAPGAAALQHARLAEHVVAVLEHPRVAGVDHLGDDLHHPVGEVGGEEVVDGEPALGEVAEVVDARLGHAVGRPGPHAQHVAVAADAEHGVGHDGQERVEDRVRRGAEVADTEGEAVVGAGCDGVERGRCRGAPVGHVGSSFPDRRGPSGLHQPPSVRVRWLPPPLPEGKCGRAGDVPQEEVAAGHGGEGRATEGVRAWRWWGWRSCRVRWWWRPPQRWGTAPAPRRAARRGRPPASRRGRTSRRPRSGGRRG